MDKNIILSLFDIAKQYEAARTKLDELHIETLDYSDYLLLINTLDLQAKEIDRLRAERDAAVSDIEALKGKSCPCHICKHADMIRCVHEESCGANNRFFEWRGLEAQNE